jgi:O-antigen/teichoic acid export membrane protein
LITAIVSNFLIFKKNTSGKYEKKIISKFFSYGFPLTGLFIFDYILTFSDRLLIGHYLGSDMVGMYGANYDLIKMMVLFGMIIQGYIIYPELNKTFEKNNLNEVKKLMAFNFNIFITVFLPLCVFILHFNNSISDIFIGKKFTIMSSELIPLFSMMFLFWGLKIHHFDYIFQLSEKTSLSMYILFFGSFINLILNFILIPRVELLGAAYATFTSYVIILLISLLISRKLLKVSIDIKILIKTGLFLAIGLTMSILFSRFGFNDFIVMAIFISCYGVLTFKYNYKYLKPYFIKFYL